MIAPDWIGLVIVFGVGFLFGYRAHTLMTREAFDTGVRMGEKQAELRHALRDALDAKLDRRDVVDGDEWRHA